MRGQFLGRTLAWVDFAKFGVLEEVEGDLGVFQSLFGHSFGSVLAHAEAVTKAVTLNDK